MKVDVYLSPETLRRDVQALMDSYAIEICKDGRVLLTTAIANVWKALGVFSAPTPGPGADNAIVSGRIHAPIDRRWTANLVPYSPPEDPDREAVFHRWPFWVSSRLSVCITVDQQWWLYIFSPGEKYEGRHYDR